MTTDPLVLSLSDDERLALVALTKQVVLSNSQVGDDEREQTLRLAAELGGSEPYRALLAEADRRFADEESLKAFLSTIVNPEARALIASRVVELSRIEGIEVGERRLLAWLAEAWGLQLEEAPVPDPPEAA